MKFRLDSIDLFRGLIILFMTIIHIANTFFFIDSAENMALSLLSLVVFGFLMLIGISMVFHYYPKFKGKPFSYYFTYLAKRALEVYLWYVGLSVFYFLMFTVSFSFIRGVEMSFMDILVGVLKVLFFVDLNYNIPILIPIAMYLLFSPFVLWALYKWDIRILDLVIIGLVCFFVSIFLTDVSLGAFKSFGFLKSLLVGHLDWLHFPFFKWLPSYFFGMYVGALLMGSGLSGKISEIKTSSVVFEKSSVLRNLNIVFGVILFGFVCYLLYTFTTVFTYNLLVHQFPVTFYHMLYASGACLFLFVCFLFFEKRFGRKNWFSFLRVLGQHSLLAYVSQWIYIWIVRYVTVYYDLNFGVFAAWSNTVVLFLFMYGLCLWYTRSSVGETYGKLVMNRIRGVFS